MTIIFNVFGWPATSMVPVIGTDYLGLGPKGVGLLASCDGIGGLLGALLIATLARAAWYGRIFVERVALYLLMVMVFASAPVVPLAAVALCSWAGCSTPDSPSCSRRSSTAPRPPRCARACSGVVSVCIGTAPIGFLYLGFLAEMFSPRTATIALAAQGVLAMLLDAALLACRIAALSVYLRWREQFMTKPQDISLRTLLCALAFHGLACGAPAAAQPSAPAGGEPQSRVSVAFVGQALIKEDVYHSAPAALAHAREALRGVDVAFTNLEVAIQPAGERLSPRSKDAVPAPPAVLDCLKSMGFNMLSLANNHAFDIGSAGMFATIDEVNRRGFTHAGTGADANAAAAPGFLMTGKGRVALVAMATGRRAARAGNLGCPGPAGRELPRAHAGRPIEPRAQAADPRRRARRREGIPDGDRVSPQSRLGRGTGIGPSSRSREAHRPVRHSTVGRRVGARADRCRGLGVRRARRPGVARRRNLQGTADHAWAGQLHLPLRWRHRSLRTARLRKRRGDRRILRGTAALGPLQAGRSVARPDRRLSSRDALSCGGCGGRGDPSAAGIPVATPRSDDTDRSGGTNRGLEVPGE